MVGDRDQVGVERVGFGGVTCWRLKKGNTLMVSGLILGGLIFNDFLKGGIGYEKVD
jgi:hypothetical protein